MKTYPKYKDSGVPWLGCIPEHWDIKPGFSVFREKQVKNKGAVENRVLSLSYGKIIIKPEEKLRGLVPESFETYQIVDKGDIIIRSTDMQNDHTSLRTGIVNNKGIITSAYICLHPIDVKFCNYNHWLLHGLDLMKVFYGLGSGLRQNLSWSDFKRLPLPVPSQDEQIQISRYLDWQTSKINKFIKARKKLITLLKEQKQNIINEAVTKGINPDAKMKDSGVSWLGEIPEHWEVRRLKSFSRINSGQVDPRAEEFNRMILIAPNHIESRTGKLLFTELANAQGAISGKYLVRKGQLLYSKIRPALRKAIIAPVDCLCSADMYGITFDRKIMSEKFALISILSDYFSKYVIDCSMRVAMPKINRDTLGITCMAIPPIEEQESIVEYIEKETVLIDKTIDRTEQEIELIQEYRTRLVSDVVTGQIDVRSVEIPDFDSVEMEQEVEGDEEAEDELITESIEE